MRGCCLLLGFDLLRWVLGFGSFLFLWTTFWMDGFTGFGFWFCVMLCYVVGIVVDCRRVLGLGVVV